MEYNGKDFVIYKKLLIVFLSNEALPCDSLRGGVSNNL